MIIPDDWTPTAENLNALPGPLRDYIHDLVALCDPAGIVLENWQMKQQCRAVETAYLSVMRGRP
jgi:hypothetical protein